MKDLVDRHIGWILTILFALITIAIGWVIKIEVNNAIDCTRFNAHLKVSSEIRKSLCTLDTRTDLILRDVAVIKQILKYKGAIVYVDENGEVIHVALKEVKKCESTD